MKRIVCSLFITIMVFSLLTFNSFAAAEGVVVEEMKSGETVNVIFISTDNGGDICIINNKKGTVTVGEFPGNLIMKFLVIKGLKVVKIAGRTETGQLFEKVYFIKFGKKMEIANCADDH